MPLSAKQRRFVAEFLIDQNATQAAIRAGYSKKTARVQGSRLMTKAAIKAEVNKGQDRILAKLEKTADMTAEEVMAKLSTVARKSPRFGGTQVMRALEILAKRYKLIDESAPVAPGGAAGAVTVNVYLPDNKR